MTNLRHQSGLELAMLFSIAEQNAELPLVSQREVVQVDQVLRGRLHSAVLVDAVVHELLCQSACV